MLRRALVLASALLLALASSCAGVSAAHRGAGPAAIHGQFTRVLGADGSTCEPSPDRSSYACTHPEITDVSFAYQAEVKTTSSFVTSA
jgi:hypothetical protein